MRGLILVGLCAACSSTEVSGVCSSNDNCDSGSVCIAEQCEQLCVADRDCATGEACLDDVCQSCANCRQVPEVVRVDGTGALDADPTHTDHHLASTVVLEGANLDGVSATLDGGAFVGVDLPLCGQPSADRVEVELPSGITAGNYTITVTNQAGACAAGMNLLEGAPGPAGTYTVGAGLTLTGTTLSVDTAAVATAADLAALEARVSALEPRVDAAAPPGTLVPFTSDAIPPGWLLCDGREVDRATEAALFAVIGITFGVGDGINTFNLPDLRGRTVVGVDGAADRIAAGWADAVAGSGGADTHTLTEAEMPAHVHSWPRAANMVNNNFIQGIGDMPTATVGGTGSTGGGTPHNNLQPSLALRYVIKN